MEEMKNGALAVRNGSLGGFSVNSLPYIAVLVVVVVRVPPFTASPSLSFFLSNNPQLASVPQSAVSKVLCHRTSTGLQCRTCPRRNTIYLTSRNNTEERIEIGMVEGGCMIQLARSDCRSLARAFFIPL